jgi:hypothetical protein
MTNFVSSTFLLLSLIKYDNIHMSELPNGDVLPVHPQLYINLEEILTLKYGDCSDVSPKSFSPLITISTHRIWRYMVAQLVEAMRFKSEGRDFVLQGSH